MTIRADAVCRALAVIAAVVSLAAPVAAHPLATTTVSIVASETGTLNLTIAADADALIARLEALAGAPVSLTRTAADRRARIESLSSTLVAHIELRSGETPLALRLQDVVVDETAQAEIHLTTAVPAGADTVTWRSRSSSGHIHSRCEAPTVMSSSSGFRGRSSAGHWHSTRRAHRRASSTAWSRASRTSFRLVSITCCSCSACSC